MEKVIERTPYDVWFNIARFIPHDVLIGLSTVNRSFLDIATSARYGVVTFSKFDKNTKWFCRNLSDSKLGHADLVRRVNIEPWVVQPRNEPCRRQSENAWTFVTGILDPDCVERRMHQQVKKRITKDIARVTEAVSGLRNLSEYGLAWDENRSYYHPELYRAFLCPVLYRLKDQLVKLSLDIPPEMFRSLVPIALPRLEHLDVGLCTLKMPSREIYELFDCFTVFVNNLYPTLESFSISTRVPSQFLDLTRFFTILGTFPRLHRFSLSIPFDGTHLSSPLVLTAFLSKHHETLQYLQLSTSRCSSADIPANPTSKYWIPNVLASINTPYPQLHGVQLALRPLKADLTPITRFLAQQAPELRCLNFTDRALTYDEVHGVLDSLGSTDSSPLKQLRLRLQHLSPALLDLLASRLPRLALLELSFAEVKATASHLTHAGIPTHSMKAELQLFEAEVRENRDNYARWELGTFGICQGRSNESLPELSRILLECIPALQSVVELSPSVSY